MRHRGEGSIFRHPKSPYFYIAYYYHGKLHRESTGILNTDALKPKAERMLKHRLKEIGADQLGGRKFITPSQRKIKVDRLLDAYEMDYKFNDGRALAQLLSHMKPIREWFGSWSAAELIEDRDAVDRYIEQRRDSDKKAPATINRETEILTRAFKLAIADGKLSSMPKIRSLPERNVRKGFYDHATFLQIHQLLPAYLQDLAMFAYLNPTRRGELLSLAWSEVDLEGRAIRLDPGKTKTGEGRVIALEGESWAIIQRRWKDRLLSCPLVFHRDGRPIVDFRKAWATACKDARAPGMLFHDLRRTAARNSLRAGAHERTVMDQGGWKTRSMFDRYNVTSEQDLREAAKRTEEYLKQQAKAQKVVRLQERSS